MKSEKDLKNDLQLKMYVLLIYNFLPKGSFDKVIIRIEYLRHLKVIEHCFDNIEEVVNETKMFIGNTIKQIENEILKTDGTAFEPRRNENCSSCFLMEEGKCPLFDKNKINNIDDPYSFLVTTDEDCLNAWKRVEANNAENMRLTKLCKEYLKSNNKTITVDKNTELGFYSKAGSSFKTMEIILNLLDKGIDMKEFINYFNISKTDFEKMVKRLKIEFSQEDMKSFSKEKISNHFTAITEAEKGKYINI